MNNNEFIEIQIKNNEVSFLYPNYFSIQECLKGLVDVLSSRATSYSDAERCWITEKAISDHRNFSLRLKKRSK